jgi:phospholipase/lecithinase/hemolysin
MNLLVNVLVNAKRTAVLGLGALTSALLVSCGGGDQVEPFVPTKLVVFGDELSSIQDVNGDARGRKYNVNALASDNVTLDCISNPIWVQYLSSSYGLVLPACNPTGVANPTSRSYALPGQLATDVAAQVTQHQATSSFSESDLVTVLAGTNDILAQYGQYPTVSEAAARANLEAAAEQLAAQVNRIANAGGRVLIATVPDLGLSPYAIAQKAANTDTDRAALLSRLTSYFNVRLRRDILNDGRRIGLLLADELVQVMVKFPATYGLTNITSPLCDTTLAVTVDQCTALTLVTGGTTSTHLWADDRRLGPAGHLRLGQAAVSRAANNPF